MVQYLENFNLLASQGVRMYSDGLRQAFNTDNKQAVGYVFDKNGEVNAEATAERMADNASNNDQTVENTQTNPGFNFGTIGQS